MQEEEGSNFDPGFPGTYPVWWGRKMFKFFDPGSPAVSTSGMRKKEVSILILVPLLYLPEVGIDTDKSRRSNARHWSNTQHSIERSERSYFFEKPKAKILPSIAIFVDRWRYWFLGIKFFNFNEKKTSHPIPRFFQRSKWSELQLVWGGSLVVAAYFCNSRRGWGAGEGWGEGRTSFANWELNGPWLLWYVSHAQTENQIQHMEEICIKIKNYVQDYGSCPLPWSLSIADD